MREIGTEEGDCPRGSTPEFNTPVSYEGAFVLGNDSLFDHLACLSSFLWIKLQAAIKRRIWGVIQRWNQMWSSISDRTETNWDGHTAFAFQETASCSPPSREPSVPYSFPDTTKLNTSDTPSETIRPYLCMTDDMTGLVSRGWSHHVDSGVQSSYTNEAWQHQLQRRRSVWVVRPSNGTDGVVNVHSRYRVRDGEKIEIVI